MCLMQCSWSCLNPLRHWLQNEVASVEDIDRAWMGVMHTLVGPFGIMDSIGIDTVWKLTGLLGQDRE